MDELMEAFGNDEITTIGVYGMGGVGKTTMVKHVGEQAQKMGLFHHVITAVVSRRPDLRKIQGTFSDLLNLKFEEETEMERTARLREKITRGSRILIILDDIWDRVDMSSIGIPSYNELQRCNSKVLLITRRLNVCHSMESQANIQLNILSEEDAWNLFVKKTRKSIDESTKFYDVARTVARECAGIPVALIAVARALKDKGFEEWKEAARRLQMSQHANVDDDERDVYECIKLCYDYLDCNDAKSCFLLCCLFPEDYDIQSEEMMKFGFGIGLFRHVNSTIEDARVIANSVMKYLNASCLLLDGIMDGCVRMHDVIREIAMSIALSVDGHRVLVKNRCELIDWPVDADEGFSAISLMENDICKLPQELVCSKLLLLSLKGNSYLEEIPESFFHCLNALRVLDLRGTSISVLPLSYSLLTNLQALYLDYCNKRRIDISILGHLKKLEILSMTDCRSKEFPKEIGNLTNLRMFKFSSRYGIKRIPSHVISRLEKLEELYLQCKFGDWGRKVGGRYSSSFGKNAEFHEVTGLSRLNLLEVSLSDAQCLPQTVKFAPNWVSFVIFIDKSAGWPMPSSLEHDFPHPRSRALSLNTAINTLPDWFNKVVTQKAEKLDYVECRGLNNIIEEYDHGRLHALKYLGLYGSHENMKELMNTRTRVSNRPVFENLEQLNVKKADCLEEMCVGELQPGSLCNLKLLVVAYSRKIVNALLPLNLLQRVQKLETLVCHHMNRMEYVFEFAALEPEQVILTEMKEMKLLVLGALISIWKGPAPYANFHNLKSLEVYECTKLRSLFTLDVAECLLQLEDLSVGSCSGLDRVIEASNEIENKNIVLPKLKDLLLKDLLELTMFCGSTTGSVIIEIQCPSLEHLYLKECPQFSTSAWDFYSKKEVQVNDEHHFTKW